MDTHSVKYRPEARRWVRSMLKGYTYDGSLKELLVSLKMRQLYLDELENITPSMKVFLEWDQVSTLLREVIRLDINQCLAVAKGSLTLELKYLDRIKYYDRFLTPLFEVWKPV